MTEKRQFRAIKGTRDILPPDSALWNWFEQTAREVFESYGFRDIRLPIFEETALFARSIGTDTDIVAKEMFTFEDYEESELSELRRLIYTWEYSRENLQAVSNLQAWIQQFVRIGREAFGRGEIPRSPENGRVFDEIEALEDSLVRRIVSNDSEVQSRLDMLKDRVQALDLGDVVTLRPEATASVARAYIEHGMHTLPGDVKLYYIGPMFRRERPQKGRHRQFYQVGAEVLGQSDAPAIDAEILEMLVVFFKRVGLTQTTLYVNSIGCKDCRPKYVEQLRQELLKVKDKLGTDSQRRIDTNPLRVLDSKLPEEQPIIENAAAHLRSSVRRLPRAFRQAERRTEAPRHRIRRELAARPRPRLLHAHDLRSHGRRPRLAERRLRRRALRRPGRASRRASDEGHRLRHRH